MITGWKKLTKAQRKHLAESSIRTNEDWRKTKEWQEHLRQLGKSDPCWDCKAIARILGGD